jgi:hypothetical protein
MLVPIIAGVVAGKLASGEIKNRAGCFLLSGIPSVSISVSINPSYGKMFPLAHSIYKISDTSLISISFKVSS